MKRLSLLMIETFNFAVKIVTQLHKIQFGFISWKCSSPLLPAKLRVYLPM